MEEIFRNFLRFRQALSVAHKQSCRRLNLDPRQAGILRALDELGPSSAADLCRATISDPATVNRAVAEAVSFAAPHPKYGEEVQAAVVLKGAVSQADLAAFCLDRLADFKVPRQIYFTDSLPRTATGKIQRRHVAAHFLAPKA